MQVGIVGAGAVAMGYAALLSKYGHSVHVWSPSGASTAALLEGTPLTVTGAIEGTFCPHVSPNVEALAKCGVIVLALPAYGHRMVIDSILPFIGARHTVIISGHLSFAALYLAKKLSERAIQIPIAVWNTTVLTAKARVPSEIKVGAIRVKIDMAALPVCQSERALALCISLFGDRFVLKDDLLTVTLSNVNPQNHMGVALTNLTRIERGEAWGQRSNITPTVGKLIEALDRERLAISTSFGKSVRTIFEHYALSFDVAGASVAEICQTLAQRGKDPVGPISIETRYVLEDVPFGLVPTLYLAKMAGVSAPLHQSGVDLLSACYGRNFAAKNDLLQDLGPLDTHSLMKLVVDGYPVAGQISGGP